jgi:hypothetical protein
MAQISKAHQINSTKYTTCFTLHRKWQRIQDFLAMEGMWLEIHSTSWTITWRIMGAVVKSMKYHLRRTLGAHIATYEELCNLLAEIESCLHSRPLCALSNGPHNITYLSPGHRLIGEPMTQLPSVDYTNDKCNWLSRWQSYQQQIQHFWERWSSDYLHGLQQRQRWQRTFPNQQPGDVVLSREDNTTPLHWPTVVIADVHPGPDGIVRVVTLRTPKGTFKRPTTKICQLPHVNCELQAHLFGGGSMYMPGLIFAHLFCDVICVII